MQYVLINIMIFLTLYIELLHEIYISYGNVCCFDPQALIYTYVHNYKKKKKTYNVARVARMLVSKYIIQISNLKQCNNLIFLYTYSYVSFSVQSICPLVVLLSLI